MPTRLHFDGDFSSATQVGQPIQEFPFQTDPQPYIYNVPYWQLKSSYAPLAKGTGGPYGGFATGIDKGQRDEGGGVISFNREFAFVPAVRSEYESFTYPFQVWSTGSGGGIAEFPFTVNSRVQFDYFHTINPELFIALPRAPRIIEAFNLLFPLNGFDITGGGDDGREVLAEDATAKIWKGNIYERKQRFVKIPSVYSFLQV